MQIRDGHIPFSFHNNMSQRTWRRIKICAKNDGRHSILSNNNLTELNTCLKDINK